MVRFMKYYDQCFTIKTVIFSKYYYQGRNIDLWIREHYWQEYIIPYREYRTPITTVQTLSGSNVTSTWDLLRTVTQESGTNSQLRHHQRSLQKQLIDMAKRAAAQDEALSPAKRVPTLQSSIVEPDISVGSLALAGQAKYDTSLNFDVGYTATKGSHLIVGCKVCHWHPPAGSISRTRVVVHEDRSYFFQVLLREKNSGKLQSVDEFLNICEMMANSKSEFKFCPGIDPAVYQSVYFSKIRYDLKQVRCMEYPFERIDSCPREDHQGDHGT